MTKSYRAFIAGSIGKARDIDGAAGVQCVDLIKAYLKECFGIKAGSWGDARRYYERFDDENWGGYDEMNKYFSRLPNTPEFVPMAGDIGVFGKNVSSSHDCGHICICSGEGDAGHFYSYDQNFGAKECRLIRHGYQSQDFLGVLRPKAKVKTELNIRSGASTAFDIIGELKKNELVTVLEKKNAWSKIGEKSWVCSKFLKGIADD